MYGTFLLSISFKPPSIFHASAHHADACCTQHDNRWKQRWSRRVAGYTVDKRRWIMPAGRRRPAATVRSRPLGVVEDASSRKDSCSYSCLYRLACRARQHDNSCIISNTPHCGSSSSSSSSSSGGEAKRAGAVACLDRAQQQQQQQQQQQSSSTNRRTEAGAGADAVYFYCSSWCGPLLRLALTSCRLLWCCLRSWYGSGGTVANSVADTVADATRTLCFCYFFCLPGVAAHPHSLPQFWTRRLQD